MSPFAEQIFTPGADLARAKADELKAEREPTLRQRLRDAYNAERKWPRRAEAARIQALLERPADPEPTLQELTQDWEPTIRANNARIYAEYARLKRERGIL